jgi:glycosyltransferase involved in cell wall biosynthesis
MCDPEITVYIPSHNYGAYLKAAVESVLRQTRGSWELLIINDNSLDQTPQIMELYKCDERIRLFHTKGIGLPSVCNLALREAKGKYLIRLDGDDVFDENILLVLSNYLQNNRGYDLVFPDYYLMDESGEILSQERREKIYDNNHVLDVPANGACSLIRVETLNKIGGYREDLGSQDGYDLWNKVLSQGKCMNVNLPLFYYRRHTSNLTNKSQRILSAKRRIKSDSIQSKIEDSRPIIGVIPTRKNYDFIPDLWKAKINGRRLLDIGIQKCMESQYFDKIIVASDNPEVKSELERHEDERLSFFARDTKETIRSCSIAKTLEQISSLHDSKLQGVTMLSYIHTPFVTTETMEEALFTLLLNDSDSAFGLEKFNHPLYRRSAHGLEAINPPKVMTIDFETVFVDSQTAMATKTINFPKGSLTGSMISNFIVSEDECFVINSNQSLRIAQTIMAQ